MSELWIFWSCSMDIKYMEDAEMYTAVYLEFIAEEIVLKIINTCKWVYYEKNGLAQWKKRDMERFVPVYL